MEDKDIQIFEQEKVVEIFDDIFPYYDHGLPPHGEDIHAINVVVR